LERSASRSLFNEEEVRGVPQLIKQQQDFLVELISDQARQRRFTSKPLEKQAAVNAGFQELVAKVLAALKRGHKKKMKAVLKQLRDRL
jgi:hypothetical protein